MTANINEPMILLVDDDANILRDYSKILKRMGFFVETAMDGDEATRLLKDTAFDVIISDLSMPKMDGLEFLKEVRKYDLDVPVILITGDPGLETAIQAIEYGAYRYLTKPVGLDELEKVTRRAVSMNLMAKLKREALALAGVEGRQLGDLASLDVRFSNALEELWMAYQPIVCLPERIIYAYEALVRSHDPLLRTPIEILDAAERLGRIHDLGRKIREQVAYAAPHAPDHALLFVNLHPADLNDPELYSSTSPLTRIASRVVLEITERASLDGVKGLSSKVANLRQLGFRIAVDDLGAGYAGLTTFSQLEPEIVKLDMALVRAVDTSTRKRSVVRAMTRLCVKDLGICVVCEGVETPQERDVLLEEGCQLLQGYLFGKPDMSFLEPNFL